ncbi:MULTISPECIES: O-antigen ligase family protein [unclassified Bradyrhizobium]|uniref:O-antigen ligase family protein n=1 Tax=unclassified Bradyrhizobium TaxID=2631580 RepID=UPI00247A96C3|nr:MULTISPECIES: O-antigen ligase family protein [unclassified Bradyrhizobium]WGS23856.1 O-antigen ligase family protein [Bradyrhizobium sp. ISRA463]WGS31166.1 O-antigen ligase family protein [Bradyrhizobium sp. ISRA464]
MPAWRDRARWATTTDVIAVLIALSLPWSTSLVGIFGVVLLIAVAPTLELRAFWALVKQPICAVPAALFALALVGTLWSDAAWGVRLYAVGPTAKLLVLPFLFYHFQRSRRGTWIFTAFLVSCTLLMVMSWLVLAHPGLSLKGAGGERGIFVKDYINQSQEFTLCAVALAYPIVILLRARRIALAVLLIVIALSFFANMAFVVVSRTALVTVPIMFAVFALLHLRWRSIALILCSAAVLAVVAWYSSPQLRWTAETFTRDYQLYKERNEPTSIGLRLEFWRKSLGFFAEAPIIGHGTGATRGLFERVATGGASHASGEVIGNPHNQTLNVAVQWGMIGVAILYAMWILHLLLFRGDGVVNWIGLLVVVQNIFTSLFNSHIFDFHEGWMYVLGVGVAGGIVLKTRSTAGTEPERLIHP